LLAHGRWFSPGTSASSTTKTGCHDIAEILLKVVLKHQRSKSNHHFELSFFLICQSTNQLSEEKYSQLEQMNYIKKKDLLFNKTQL
jgi:hypothetical protein